MSRIKPEDMNKLISAADAKEVASTAEADLEEMAVAACINTAANTGSTEAVYAKPISEALQTKLKGQGYTITTPNPIARPGDVSVISWKDAE